MPRVEMPMIDANGLELMTLTMFPIFTGSELMGWPLAASLLDDHEIRALGIAAAHEVLKLRLADKVKEAALKMPESDRFVRFLTTYEKDAWPLDRHAFHHGGGVAAQDFRLLRDYAAAEESQGKAMASLKKPNRAT